MKHILFLALFFAGTIAASPIVLMPRPALAAPVAGSFADPAMEARARALQRQLRCLVCQGESIDESNASLAADLRHLVRQQMAEGKSDAQIKQYLVAPYVLWLAPFVVLLGAGGVAFWAIRRAKTADGLSQ
jgi:cytochrome c-type biogenesis protein CcmH